MHLEGAGAPREREFLLFSDCLIWLAAGDGDSAEQWENPPPSAPPDSASRQFIAIRPPMIRQRSKSEAALPRVRDIVISAAGSPAPSGFSRARSVIPPKPKKKQRLASTVQDERWVYRGSAELVDVDVVVSPLGVDGEDRRIEILSPQGSFALYAGA
jgi:FYVE, RhoGEF and PH domain containing 5/6